MVIVIIDSANLQHQKALVNTPPTPNNNEVQKFAKSFSFLNFVAAFACY